MTLSTSQLRRFLPSAGPMDGWVDALNAACPRFGIVTTARLAAFLAQIAHESAEFRRLLENLNYSAGRLVAVWPKRFPTLASALPYEHQPEKLANHVYAGRLGNGDEASGDGWRYRGRGLIQLTGRDNYREIGVALHLPLEAEPDQVVTPPVAALSAARFWTVKGCNELADLNTEDAFDRISRRINGGNTGLEGRRAYWARAKTALLQDVAA